MKRWRHAFGAVCSIAVLAPLSLGAQQFGAGFAAGYNVFGGSDYENTDGALQFEGVVRVAFEGSFQLGVGAMMAGYDIDVVDESVKHLQVFAEPRWVFETASNITPFIAGRAAWSKETAEFYGSDLEATGWAFGSVAGIGLTVNDGTMIEISALLGTFSLGDVKANRSTLPNTDSSGRLFAIRVGFSILAPR